MSASPLSEEELEHERRVVFTSNNPFRFSEELRQRLLATIDHERQKRAEAEKKCAALDGECGQWLKNFNTMRDAALASEARAESAERDRDALRDALNKTAEYCDERAGVHLLGAERHLKSSDKEAAVKYVGIATGYQQAAVYMREQLAAVEEKKS